MFENSAVRYRYYVSKTLITPRQAVSRRQKDADSNDASTPIGKEPSLKAKNGLRLPAAGIERLVLDRLVQFLASPAEVLAIAASDLGSTVHPDQTFDAVDQSELLEAAQRQASSLSAADIATQRSFLLAALQRVDVHRKRVEFKIDRLGVLQRLNRGDCHEPDETVGGDNAVVIEDDVGTSRAGEPTPATNSSEREIILLTVPVAFKRSGFELRLVVPGKKTAARTDPSLARLIARAHHMRDRLVADPEQTITQLADQERLTASYLTRLLRLAFLAPDIVSAILEGRQPLELSANKLMADTRLPIEWAGQRQALGFE